MASRKRDLIKTFLQLTVYLLWKPPVTAIQPSTLEPTTYKLRNYHITISNTSPYFDCYPSNDFFDQSILKMRTRRETVTKDHDTENEKSNDEGRPVGTVKQDMEISSENGIHSNPEISSAEIGLIDDVEHHEIDIDSLVTKTLQRFSSSKYNSKSKACSTLHSRLMSSGKLGDRKLQTLKGAIENRTWKAGNAIEDAQNESTLYDNKSSVAAPLKEPKIVRPETVGKGWFDFQPLVIDEKIKRDIKMIQMRNYLDPKRFYKNPDKMGKVLHVGTVIEGPSEYFSSRLSRKDRKQTIVEEILGDQTLKNYSKRKYAEIQFDKSNKKRMFRVKKRGGKK